MSCFMVMSAPFIMPKGIMNMLATEWSMPIATKPEMGKKTAQALEARSLCAVDIQTAMHTSQLQMTPRAKPWAKVQETLPIATATALAETPVEATVASLATAREPTKLPAKTTPRFLSRLPSVALPAAYAAVQTAMLPVTSSPPPPSTMRRPMGRPRTPMRARWRPGLAPLRAGTEPPQEMARSAPSAMCAPLRNERGMSLSVGVAALPAPRATALS
mmetsp:Transcript_20253/g.60421  ORF Transcript_20253/g.60421 Transcript_20253/m.60421 type:complete len:217 (+) Transcript_20253:175-825(+)